MPRRFDCPDCGKPIVTFLRVGEVATCRECGIEVLVPESATETEERPQLARPQTDAPPVASSDTPSPESADELRRRGNNHYDRGEMGEAVAAYTEALRLDPRNVPAYLRRAAALRELRRFGEAIVDCDAAIRLDPESGLARGARYAICKVAVAAYTKALRLDPRNVPAYLRRAAALRHLGRYDEAIEDCDAATRLDPESSLARTVRDAICKEKAGGAEPATCKEKAGEAEAATPVALFRDMLGHLTPRVFVTQILVAVNVVVFVAMVASGVDGFSPKIRDLVEWGADFGPYTTQGEWWRLLTSTFLHIGVIHLACNMWVLWGAGHLVERLVGNVGFLVLYLACGLIGSLASVFWNPLLVSAGASGAIFGVIGALLGFLLRCRGSIPLETLSALRNSGLAFVLYNLPLGLMHKEVDVAAHVGGLVAGFLCGLAMGQPVRPEAAAGRRARNLWVAAGALACVTLAILALSKIGGSEEFARQRAEALKGEPIGPENEEMPKIRELLESLGQAFRAANGTELKELFDVDRMYEEVRGLGVLEGIPVRKERQVVEALRDKLPESLAQYADFSSYARFDIKNCQFLAERGEAVLSVRHWAEDGRASRIRWWLKKRGGRWRVYDSEELRFPVRYSSSVGIGFSQAREEPRASKRMLRDLPRLMTAAQAVMQGDLNTAEKALAGIDDSQWPGVLKACRALLQGAVHLDRGRPAEALAVLDQAERAHSDMPMVSMLRAMAFNAQGEHAKAKAMAEKYIEQVGGDADIYFQLGCALAGLARNEEAAEAHRKGLDDDPSSLDNLLGLAAVLPEGQKEEVGRRFAKLQRPAEKLQAVWKALVEEGDTESIEAIVAAYARVQSDRAKVVEAFHQLAGLYRGEESYDKLAWLLATCPEEKVRDGRQALEYARKACELSKWQDERCLEILAAAYAELGRFGEAVKWQKKVLESPGLAKKEQAQLRARLKLYEEGKPYREAR